MTDHDDAPETGESTRDYLGDVDRRDYLRTVGTVGAAAAVGSGASGGAAAQSSDWEAAAEERIAEHRKGTLEVRVENESGQPVSNADVEIEMQEHDFGFGTAIHAEFLTRGTEWGEDISYDGRTLDSEDQQQYRDTINELFNEVVLENLHKWYLWEDNTDIADEAVDWCVNNGLGVRGHVCIWGNLEAYALPPRVVEAMGDPWASNWSEAGEPNKDIQTVRDEASSHIDEIINHYGSDIKEWEVVNEVLHKPSIIEAIEGQDVTAETAPILGDWYEQAAETAGQYDIPVAINDYNVMAENNYSEPDRYEDQMDFLANERGIDINVGMQCHFALDERKSPDEIMQTLDRYAEYGQLNTTELDMFVNGWDEQQQADYLYQYLKTFFSHPEAKDFLVWGHWTPLHWGDDYGDSGDPQDAPFFRGDWSEKPALDEYRELVFNQWWTEKSGSTDSSGSYTTDVFLGEHEITVDGETTTVSVTDSDGVQQVTVTGSGDTVTPEPDGPPAVGDNQNRPTDPDGDGLYEDVNGNGDQDLADATDFYQNRNTDEIQNHVDHYDYTGNDEIDLADIVELFQENTS